MKKAILLVCALAAAVSGFAAEVPRLKVGDPAPALTPGKWIQGEPVTSFARDKAYVVEFWATWCGPCKKSIPELNELHLKYKDKGLVIIGQSVWEEDDTDVPKFVKQMGRQMSYRVATDDKSKVEKGAMALAWMEAAGQNGIPTAFVVSKQGSIAWIGSPFALKEKLLEDVLAGTYDVKKAAADYVKRIEQKDKFDEAWEKFMLAANGRQWDKAEELLTEVAKFTPEEDMDDIDHARLKLKLKREDFAGAEAVANKLAGLASTNAPDHDKLAWTIVTSGNVSKGLLDIADHSASEANKLTDGKNSSILETLARVKFMKGDKASAIEAQQKALDFSDEKEKKSYQKALDSYKAGKLPEA